MSFFFHSCVPSGLVVGLFYVLILCAPIAHQDTDSDHDAYAPRPEPSQESLPPQSRFAYTTESSTFMDYPPPSLREAYAAWSSDRQIPLSKEEIEDVFLDLTQKFGFQKESMRNMVCFTFSSELVGLSAFGRHLIRRRPFLPSVFLSLLFLIKSLTDRPNCPLVRLLDAVAGQSGIPPDP